MQKHKNLPTKAVIYCRVSSQRQVDEGSGLSSQEKTCRNYAKLNNLTVERVFRDEGISGGVLSRPELDSLIDFLSRQKERYVVIIDGIDRLARDVTIHFQLKAIFESKNALIRSPKFDFKEDDPHTKLIEGISALFAQYHRESNRAQVISRQKARLELGYWPFNPPKALVNIQTTDGKLLTHREPYASIYRDALLAFEADMLNSFSEVKDYVNKQLEQQEEKYRLSMRGAEELLHQPLYAGLIEYKPWGIERRQARHSGLVSERTYDYNVNKLKNKNREATVSTRAHEFPLRGFMHCSNCGKRMYGSRHNNGKKNPNVYEDYWCQSKKDDCDFGQKITRKKTVHDDFTELLEKSAISENLETLVTEVFNDVWQTKKTAEELLFNSRAKRIKKLSEQIEQATEVLISNASDEVKSAINIKIEKMVKEQKSLHQKNENRFEFDQATFGTCLERVFGTLNEPNHIWEEGNYTTKKAVQRMFFPNGIYFHYNDGFGTQDLHPSINLFKGIEEGKIPDVEMGGSEPPSVSSFNNHRLQI